MGSCPSNRIGSDSLELNCAEFPVVPGGYRKLKVYIDHARYIIYNYTNNMNV